MSQCNHGITKTDEMVCRLCHRARVAGLERALKRIESDHYLSRAECAVIAAEALYVEAVQNEESMNDLETVMAFDAGVQHERERIIALLTTDDAPL